MADVKVDDETMTEEEYDHELNVAHWQGKADALSDAVGLANGKAGNCFSARDDAGSAMWRKVADWLAGLHRNAQKIYENLKDGVTDDECK